MGLNERDAKTAGSKSNVNEHQNAVAGRLKAKIVGDALHLQLRLRLVHNAIEIGNLLKAAVLTSYRPSYTSFS